MFAKVALATIPFLSGVSSTKPKEGIENLENHTFSICRESLISPSSSEFIIEHDGKVASEPQGRFLFASARIASSVAPTSLENLGSDEISTIVSAYRRALMRSDSELEGTASQLKGVFSRSDWSPPQNGSPSRVHRDQSKQVTFDNVGNGVGDASYEVRALTYDFLIQLSLFERIPESEIKGIVAFMLASSDGNPGVDSDGTKGLFRLTANQLEAAAVPVIKAWEKKASSKLDLPNEFLAEPLEAERLIHNPLAQSLGVVSLYLEARQEVKKADKRGLDAPGFQENVWNLVAHKLATADLNQMQSMEQEELARNFSGRQTEISKTKRGAEKATALKALDEERKEAEARLEEKHSEEILAAEARILDRIDSGNRRLGERGVSGKTRSESLESYLRLMQINGQW